MPKPKGKKGKPQKQKEPAGGKAEDVITPHNKIYVANLADMDLDDAKFRELFQSCGEILSADLVVTSSQVFGFVEFASVEEAETAIDKMNGQSGMTVKFAKPPALPTAKQATAFSPIADEEEEKDEDEEEDEEEEKKAEVEPPRTTPVHKLVFAPTARVKKDYTERPVECLQQLVQKATRATSTSDLIVYTVADAEWGGFVATVEVVLPGVHTSHVGEPEQNKKEARFSAARVALFDPEVHQLLPELPKEVKEVREAKVAKAESSDDGEGDSSADASEPEDRVAPAVVLSAKKQKQIAKAELRAKRQDKRQAAKAAKAKLASESGEDDDDDSAAGTDSDAESSKDADDSDIESDDESTSGDSDSDDVDLAALTAKKAAIRAELAAKKGTKKPAVKAGVQAVMAETQAKARKAASKATEAVDFRNAENFKDGRLQANFGQTKFIKP